MKIFETPDFNSEREEAEWWDTHQDEVLVAFEEAAKDGTLGRDTFAQHGMRAFDILNGKEPSAPETKEKSAA